MKILHYSLGMPPYRSGGLTKYATDLMKGQQALGHKVSLLWPGRMRIINKFTRINEVKLDNGIECYELINPHPVSLLNGINDIESYIAPDNINVYRYFLIEHNFDIIHVHTLMGIHKEFFEAAKSLGIRIVYTTHDYFGICPKVNLLNRNKICENVDDFTSCKECNNSALSLRKIKIIQAPIYRYLKETKLISSMRSNIKNKQFANDAIKEAVCDTDYKKCSKDYKKLRSYYYEIFNMVDTFHFNSSNTKRIFEKYINIRNSRVISISHNGISDNRKIKKFSGKLKITYLGAAEYYKGFDLIKKVLDDMYNGGDKDFELNIFTNTNKVSEYMNVKNGYKYNELEKIFKNTDLLVVPSVWNETFGFVALEGLSYGVPVMLTKNVGAKDIFEDENTVIIVEPNYKDLKEKISMVYKDKCRKILTNINRNIVMSSNNSFEFSEHVNRVVRLY